jgi:peptidoglycan/LPS O-acetylase OafA/YrhL
LPLLVLWQRRCRPAIAALALSALLALLADATICGIFSGPDDRYQGRLTPIAAVVVLMVALASRRRRARAGRAAGLQRARDLR